MEKAGVFVVALVVVLATGGCTFFESESTPVPTESAPESPSPPAEPPGTHSPTSSFFVGADGSLDGETLTAYHVHELRQTGNVTVRTNLTLDDGITVTTQTTETNADLANDRYLTHEKWFGPTETVRYTAGNRTYVKTVTDGTYTTYDTTTTDDDHEAGSVPAVLRVRAIQQLFGDDVDLTQEGTTEWNGTEVVEFSATEVEDWNPARDDAANVTAFEATVLVDRSGVVRLIEYRLVEEYGDETVEVTMRISFEDVGDTTVTEPDWVDEARESEASERQHSPQK